jgi:3'(2'), 5'-bisphosphate nucleotidase
MSIPLYDDPEVRPVIEAIRQAGRLSRQIRDGLVEAIKKADRSPVTVADFAVQCVIARFLQSHSRLPLVAEEAGEFLRSAEAKPVLDLVTDYVRRQVPDAGAERIVEWIDRGTAEPSGRFWTLDPIDGTKGFLRGNHYAIALALIEEGAVTLGVIGCPTLDVRDPSRIDAAGTLAIAARGRGAWRSSLDDPSQPWQRMEVSLTADLGEATVLQSLEAGHTDQSGLGAVMQRLGIQRPAIRMDSLGKYVVLAAGAGEVFCRVPTPDRPNYKEKIWDQAGGAILIAEAGGRVSDIDGKPLDFSTGRSLQHNRGVLATNGRLHEPFLAALTSL